MSAELALRKDFTVRGDEILLRWIAQGPAGAIEVYAPVTVKDGTSSFDSPKAEIHRHAFAPSPDSCEAHRTDCDLMPDGRCYFTAWWGAAGRAAWDEAVDGDDEIWKFLRHAYACEFNAEDAPKPEWLP